MRYFENMPTEYLSLITITFFYLFAWFPTSLAKARTYGGPWLASNRDSTPGQKLPIWGSRFQRAYQNLKDYFPGFLIAIFILGSLNKFNYLTSVFSWGYVASRVGHYFSYGLGSFTLGFLFYLISMFCNLALLVLALK